MKRWLKNAWARVTFCRCRKYTDLDHEHRYYHIRR